MLLNIKVLFGFILTNLFSMILLLVIYFYYLTYINLSFFDTCYCTFLKLSYLSVYLK